MAATQNTHSLGIDVTTSDARKLMSALARRKSTLSVTGPFPYHEDATLAQIHIETTMDEAALDHWLWAVKHGANYVGVFERAPA